MKTFEVTLPDSGAKLRVKRISPMTIMGISRQFPGPKPPVQEVDYGASKRLEPNPLAPSYLAELAEHQQKLSLIVLRAFIRLGVEVEVDAVAVAAYRADMAALGIKLENGDDDKYVYVANILCETNDDLVALRGAIEGSSIPTEGKVAEAQAAFPGNVQGAGHLEVAGSQERRDLQLGIGVEAGSSLG